MNATFTFLFTCLLHAPVAALAATGIRFTPACAHAVCCPARAEHFAGPHSQCGGIVHFTQGDRYGANVLKSSGYRDALFGRWHPRAKVGHGPLDQWSGNEGTGDKIKRRHKP